eukprot:GFUD01054480.1.p1 GENE.GFUD01054480.1~~GFUD01054480.1.p1  ORF type:complete len:126 (-),score=3.16 GFUD01054480.1:134-511(-)
MCDSSQTCSECTESLTFTFNYKTKELEPSGEVTTTADVGKDRIIRQANANHTNFKTTKFMTSTTTTMSTTTPIAYQKTNFFPIWKLNFCLLPKYKNNIPTYPFCCYHPICYYQNLRFCCQILNTC